VLNKIGLHARPATEWVHCAMAFRSALTIWVNDQRYDGQRIMDLLLAKLDEGATFTLEAVGPDAEAAVARLEKLLVDLRDRGTA